MLDVQTDLLIGIATRVMVPLLPRPFPIVPAQRLNPIFQVAYQDCVMATQSLVAIPAGLLKSPVASLAARSDEITDALDMLLQGF